MQQPQGFEVKGQEHKVCKLCKALYGLKQAPRTWYDKIHKYLLSQGFVNTHTKSNLYVLQENSDLLIFMLYVDDILLTHSNT